MSPFLVAVMLIVGSFMLTGGVILVSSIIAYDSATNRVEQLEIRLREAGYKFAPVKDHAK